MPATSLFKFLVAATRAQSLVATCWLAASCDECPVLPNRFPKGNLGSGGQRQAEASRLMHASCTHFCSGAFCDGRHFRTESCAAFRRTLIMHVMRSRA